MRLLIAIPVYNEENYVGAVLDKVKQYHGDVLVVDDEPQLRHALSVNLRARGYVVHQAGTGNEALRATADTRPDAVILDLGLPDLAGVEVDRDRDGVERVVGGDELVGCRALDRDIRCVRRTTARGERERGAAGRAGEHVDDYGAALAGRPPAVGTFPARIASITSTKSARVALRLPNSVISRL